jgi:hypothetical protein
MPRTSKPTSTRRRSRTFREPAALKRLSKSLDAAYNALAELRTATGRDVSQAAHDVYEDVRTLITDARRDTGKLAKALARDFEQAGKDVGAVRGRSRPKVAAGRPRAARAPAKRGTREAA